MALALSFLVKAAMGGVPGSYCTWTCPDGDSCMSHSGGTYVQSCDLVQGRYIWNRISPDNQRFVFKSGTVWTVTSETYRAEVIANQGGGGFGSSSAETSQWYNAHWAGEPPSPPNYVIKCEPVADPGETQCAQHKRTQHVTPFAETFGGISLIVYLVCGIAALCGFVLLGAAINRFALKRRGFEAWAHTKLLLQFPLLVVDGVIFTFTLGKRRPTLTRGGELAHDPDAFYNEDDVYEELESEKDTSYQQSGLGADLDDDDL